MCNLFLNDGQEIDNQYLPSYFINSLYVTDRGITWYTNLKKLCEQGEIILLDRYTTYSLVYQSALMKG